MKKRTKILATIGPASDSLETIQALILAGVNVFRLNFSHGTHEYHYEVLQKIRQAEKNTGFLTGVLQDISGPKIRVGMIEEPFKLQENDTVEFVAQEVIGVQLSENSYRTCINKPAVLKQLSIGDYIYLYDGMIRTKVIEASALSVKVIVENSGMLSSRKGVNFPNTRLSIEIITKKDKRDMLWGAQNDVDFMAISFVQNASDMIQAREILKEYGGRAQLFAKIEKFDAIEDIDAIIEASDGIMVARGDLGIEVPFYEVPSLQKMLIRKANEAAKPVVTATQMLLSMTQKDRATRAEISDIANAVLDGTDAVMLSEESAVGHNPVLAVKTMFETIQGAEKIYSFNEFSKFKIIDAADSVNQAAARLCEDVDAWGIIALTTSGTSARKIARYRPSRDIYGVTHDIKVSRFLTVCWGIVPAFLVKEDSLDHMLRELMRLGFDRKVLHLDKSYILTAGDPIGVEGSTNMIRILRAREMEYFRLLEDE
ncbi:MAG: pyruvate kinase [Sulfurimonas sp.]|uniref:pyruvate kinase n=1 Tax=Sulfurimonas sp. TaxID=2022749 RepID=UPI0025EFD3F1|nr:pyruvate kinase [Sulfurimonas sp.]MCK9491864.1 pyruvate kinase [Sulfurimonas sp.]